MNIPINLFMWILAILPIAVLLVLMLKFNWGATEAAAIGMMITIFTGIFFYKADLFLIASESAKGIWNALVILLIVWTAILMYQVGVEAKAFAVIKNGMKKLLPNELLLILAMGWIFVSFLQGITGFGVPVAVGAPLLIGIGMTPLWAVIIPLIGQAGGNTFGTLAAAWDSLAMSADLAVGSPEYWQAAAWIASFLFFWNAITGVVICWFYGKGKAVKKAFPAILAMTLIQGGGQLILSQINTTLCNFIPACLAMVVLLLMGRMKMYREEWSVSDSPIMVQADASEEENDAPADMNLVQAFLPYFVLSALTLIVLLVGPINSALGKISVGLPFPETSTGYGYVNAASASYSPFQPLTHASMFLFLSAIAGLVYYRKKNWIKAEGVKAVFLRSITMTMPSGMSVIGLVIMSKIMSGTGQTDVLAYGISNVLGKGYLILAPFVGFLGTFMTGSNMSSNILFGAFQAKTAALLGVEAPGVLGASSAGGAIGACLSPSKIILGTTTANILGKEGEVMKKIILVAVPATLAIGLTLFVLIGF